MVVSLAGCTVWQGKTYRIGAEPSSVKNVLFETRKDCEAWVAEQIKIGNASNCDCRGGIDIDPFGY